MKNLWEGYKDPDEKRPLFLLPQIGSFCYFVKDQAGSFHFFETIYNFMANEVGYDGENEDF